MKVRPDDLKQVVVGYAAHEVDEMAAPSYTHANPLIRWIPWYRIRTAQNLVRQYPSETVLDFGTGTGIMLPFLVSQAKRVIAVDQHIKPAMRLAELYHLEHIEFHEVSKAAIPIADKQVDLMLCLEVLEHIQDLPALIVELKRVLKPRGVLLVSSPTENTFYKIGRKLAGFHKRATYHHWDAAQVNHTVMQYLPLVKRKLMFPFFRLYEFTIFQKEV